MKNKKSSFKLLFSFLLGILFVGGGVYAATTVASSTITYSNSNSTLSATNLQKAIDGLYTKAKSSASSINALPNIVAAYKYSTATATECTTGNESTCVVTYCYTSNTSGSCEPGTIIKYKVNDSEIKAFNVISDNGDTIDMQSIDKIKDINWHYYTNTSGPVHSISVLNGVTKYWTNVNDQNYIMGHNGVNSSCSAYNNCSLSDYDLTITGKARFITLQEANALGCTNNYGSCPEWLPYTGGSGREMIWTMNTVYGTTDKVWVISHYYYPAEWSLDDAKAMKAVVNINKPV